MTVLLLLVLAIEVPLLGLLISKLNGSQFTGLVQIVGNDMNYLIRIMLVAGFRILVKLLIYWSLCF